MSIWKRLAFAVFALFCALLVAAVVAYHWPPSKRPAPAGTYSRDTARVERGRYLAHSVLVCFHCHAERDFALTGAPVVTPGAAGRCLYGFPGVLCPPNITPHPTDGLGEWTDGEVARVIREGVDRKNAALFPTMPYLAYRNLSDDDTEALVAYLQSMPAVSGKAPARDLDFPLDFFARRFAKPLEDPVVAPSQTDEVAYGRYLSKIALCETCHTPMSDSGEPIDSEFFGGGVDYDDGFGKSVTANITPDEKTGIGSMTREQFIGRFKAYETLIPSPPVRGRVSAMPWVLYAGMSESDLGAIYSYLRTVKPIEKKVITFPDG